MPVPPMKMDIEGLKVYVDGHAMKIVSVDAVQELRPVVCATCTATERLEDVLLDCGDRLVSVPMCKYHLGELTRALFKAKEMEGRAHG